MQRELHYAIVDEVDNILIDEARTPLIISGPSQENTQTYFTFARLVPRLQEDVDFTVELKHRAVSLTEEGVAKLEQWLGVKNIYDPQNYRLTRYMEAALKAEILYKRDRDYVVKDGEVVIVDDFTGRLMFGRRWSDGLHQAVEAKEGVKIQQESITYATITLQNYFRLYGKLAGMTGTAWTERDEFFKIYRLDVIVIPTHQELIRHEYPDFVYRNEEAKFRAVAKEIEERNKAGPAAARRHRVHREVGVPRRHAEAPGRPPPGAERQVPREGGRHHRPGRPLRRASPSPPTWPAAAPTSSSAARPKGATPGGVAGRAQQGRRSGRPPHHRHGAPRGPAHRQPAPRPRRTPGRPRQLALLRLLRGRHHERFAPDWLPKMMGSLGMDEDTPIESGMVSKAIETAQTKVEGYNFDIRKHVVEYDDVMNMHRDVIYSERRKILEGADLRANILDMVREEICGLVDACSPGRREEDWDVEELAQGSRHHLRPAAVAHGEERSKGSRAKTSWRRCSPPPKRSTSAERRRWARSRCACSSAWSCCASSTPCGSSTSRRWTRCARASA